MPEQHPLVSIVVPVFDDLAALQRLTAQLADSSIAGDWPVIVVEGVANRANRQPGLSHSEVAQWCCARGLDYVAAPASRGEQIAEGIARATTDWIWVLHADSEPSAACLVSMQQMSIDACPRWGRFNVRIPGLSIVAGFMNLRSRVTRICTGDQGMFFMRELLDQAGGFPRQPLMEDIEVSKRLKRHAPKAFAALSAPIQTSNRRWRQRGVVRTVVSMWWYRVRYFAGVSAHKLYQSYYGGRRG